MAEIPGYEKSRPARPHDSLTREQHHVSEDKHRTLFETMAQGVVYQDAGGRIISANPAAAKLLGLTIEQMQGLTSHDPRWHAIHEDGTPFEGDSHPSMVALRTGEKVGNVIMGVYNLQEDGYRWINIHAVPLFKAGDKSPYQVYTTFDDITARKKAEQELEYQNRLMSTLLDNLQVGVFMAEAPTGKPLLANNRARELIGRGIIPEAESSNLAEVYQAYKSGTDELYPKTQLPIVAAMSGKHASVDDMEVIHPDGKHVHLEVFGSPVKDRQGNVKAGLVSFSDITERKKSEEALRASQEQLHAILEANPDPVVVYNVHGHPEYLNPAFTELFGWTLEELDGQRIPFVPEEEREITLVRLKEIYSNGKPIRFLASRLTKMGEQLDVMVSAATIKGHGGETTGMVVNLTDISGQRSLEAQLRQAQKMESVGRLAGGIAHDFNNMLGVILGHADLALGQVDPGHTVHNDLTEITKAAERSAALIRQLLAFARKQAAAPKILDLNVTISGIIMMLKRLIGEDIELNWIPGDCLWPVKIDPAQVDQILANLFVNARDAIASIGKITIKTENATVDAASCDGCEGLVPGEYTTLTVIDDGCGMDKETLDKVFEPFFTTKGIGEGTGLGLSTVYGIVKQNNGYVYAHSRPDRGTTFRIYLPRMQAEAAPDQTLDAQPVIKGTETLLLVEDEECLLKLCKTMLEKFGYTILAAPSPADAIEIAKTYERAIHLLVTDVVMPDINGKDLRNRIEQIRPSIKTLFMSGYTADVIARQGIQEEDLNFIQKPFAITFLARMVRAVLDGERLPKQP